MTIESGSLSSRFHFDLTAQYSRSVEREYSSSFPSSSNDRAVKQDTLYSRANSINVLEKALSDGLGKRLGLDSNGRESSPARTITKNVLSFVRQELREARNSGASEQQLQGLLNQAREGIEQGFSSARDALQGRYNYEPGLERQIERAYNKIQRGLERLDNRFTPNVDASTVSDSSDSEIVSDNTTGVSEPQLPNSPTQLQQVEFSKTKSVQRSSSFDLSIKTQEGDTVTLSIEKFYNKQLSKQAVINEDGFTVNVDRQVERGKEISYQVSGDINEQEQAAIDSLIKKIDRLADKFYSGNIAGAFQKATRIGIDSEQLANFSVNLQSSKIVEVTKTYREVQGVQAPEPEQPLVASLGAFIHQIEKASRDEEVANAIAEPIPVATELFKQIAIRDERYSQLTLTQSVEVVDEIADLAKDQLLAA